MVAKDLQTRLRKLGYEVPVTVPTGEEAIAQARDLLPELILMDIRLRGSLDGIETALKIQESRRTPVIYLTANADEGTLGRAKLTEPFGYILKPFNERELHTAIQVALFKHEAEAARLKSERWLAATLRGMGEAVIAVDGKSRIVFMNPLAQSLTGWPGDSAVGQPLGEVFRAVDSQTGAGIGDDLAKSLYEGRPINPGGDLVLKTKGGAGIAIEDSAAPIRDDDGSVSGAVLVFRDITQRRQGEEALRRSEEKFRLLVEGIAEYAIFMLDLEGNVDSWNAGIQRITGFSAEEIVQKHCSIFYSPEDQAAGKPERALKAATAAGSWQEEGWRVRKDGSRFLADVLITALRDSAGKPTGFAELTRDISAKRRDEEQMRQVQKLESLGVLAGGIAHDFNNLLTGILANCSMVMEDLPRDDSRRRMLHDASRACVSASELTQQLLTYAGKARTERRAIDMSELITEIGALVRTSVPRHIRLDLRLAESLPAVEGDSGQLQQVIMNLVINAAEAMEKRPGSVIVTTGTEGSGSHTSVVVTVKDSGCGMEPDVLARIFEPFFTTKFQGRGLGLAAVMAIVRAHCGTLTAESVPGEGTVFKLVLPATAMRPVVTAPEKAVLNPAGTSTILVVDDDEAIRTVAQRALERKGYSVIVAEDGRAALDILTRGGRRIDAVLLDLTMPGLTGDQLIPMFRKHRFDLPVILSTGYGQSEVGRLLGKEGVEILQKPYTIEQLASKMKSVVKAREVLTSVQ